MEQQILALENQKKYKEICDFAADIRPETCGSSGMAYAVGKALEKEGAFSKSIPWYIKYYELAPSDEALGMIVGVCLAINEYETIARILNGVSENEDGYYYRAAKYELAFRTGAGIEKEIEALEAFLDIQEEESYMLRLVGLYLQQGRYKEAGRICKKINRLFIRGKSVDYANALLAEIKSGTGLEYVKRQPWKDDYVFKHVNFEMPKKPEQVEQPEKEIKKEKEEKKERISPIIEKCFMDVVGMQELKLSMNSLFHMMQASKRRAGACAILKDNIKILGPDGCGKTTAAKVAAKALFSIGIIEKAEPVAADYFSLVGATSEETFENVRQLFCAAENGCILIENIQEFDDGGAYSLGLDAIDQLVKAYFSANEKIPLIITGSEKEVEALLGKKRKLGEIFNLPAVMLGKYTAEELVKIAAKLAEEKSLILEDAANDLLLKKMEHMFRQPDFKFSRDLDRMLNEAYIHQVSRIAAIRRPSESDYYIIKSEDFTSGESVETVEELLEELNRLTGLAEVKAQVEKIVNQVTIQKMREESGITTGQGHGSLHLVFLGNAGTGKTTVARIIGKIYKRLGVLPSGQLVECTRRDLVSQYVGATAQKVSEKVKEAMGGILFIDEAYSLCKGDNDTYGREAIDALLTDIENHRDSLMVILAGYSDEMNRFMDQNQGLRSRIPTNITFADYSTEEMVCIFKKYVKDQGLMLDVGLEEEIFKLLDARKKKKDFGNARGVRNVFEEVVLNQNNRLGGMDPLLLSKSDFLIIRKDDLTVSGKDADNSKSAEKYIEELNALTGLASVKEKVNHMIASVRVNKKMEEAGIAGQGYGTLHMVFKGNPGTGKTTVARLIGDIYRELGVLSSGQLIECDRSSLVAGYAGQTALKVKEKVKEALGGILFIDEAYSLSTDSFGREAIDTLVADIENYRDDLMVIIAGYSDSIDDFLQQNQGLKSRFPNEIIFEDYSTDEMLSIFQAMVRTRNLIISEKLDDKIREIIQANVRREDFGNARGIRNLLDKVCEQRNVRISNAFLKGQELSNDELKMITEEDFCGLVEETAETKSVEELLLELNELIGLASVKEKVNKIVSTVRVNKEMEAAGLPTQKFGTLHMVFKGNAGTGKTTVARMIGNIYKELGVLSSGHLVECDRSGLVAGYVGQTAAKVKEKVQEALGGILFIDEAYALVKGGENDFGKEAIDALVADIENYRENFMVIIAGYSKDMEQFLNQNQGLRSRFPQEILFEDYTVPELLSIFKTYVKSHGLVMNADLDDLVLELIKKNVKESDFGNARGVRNLVEKICEQRNVRLVEIFNSGRKATTEELQTIIEEDIKYFL